MGVSIPRPSLHPYAPRRRGDSPCAMSEAASLPILISPPPDTTAVWVKLVGALPATLTVNVRAGKLAPLASTSARVAVTVWPLTEMAQPLTVDGPVYVNPI